MSQTTEPSCPSRSIRTRGPDSATGDSLMDGLQPVRLLDRADLGAGVAHLELVVQLLSERAQSIYDTYPVAVDEGMSKSYPFGYNGYKKV